MRLGVARIVGDGPARRASRARAGSPFCSASNTPAATFSNSIGTSMLAAASTRRRATRAASSRQSSLGGAQARAQHGERGRCAARVEQHARGVDARDRAHALGEVAGGVQRIDRIVELDLARGELRDDRVGPLVGAGVAGVRGEARGLRGDLRGPAVGALAMQPRDRPRQHGGLLGPEDARRDRRVVAREARRRRRRCARRCRGCARRCRARSCRPSDRRGGAADRSRRAPRAPRDRRARGDAGAPARAPRRRPCAAHRRACSAARSSRRGSARAPARRRTRRPARARRGRPRAASANTTSSQRLTRRSPRASSSAISKPAGVPLRSGPSSANSASIARRLRVSAAKPDEPRRIELDRACVLPSARATTPLFAARGTKSAMSRAIRRASVVAPIATRSPSAASTTSIGAPPAAARSARSPTCSSRPGSVSSTRHSSSRPRRHSPGRHQRARRREPRDRHRRSRGRGRTAPTRARPRPRGPARRASRGTSRDRRRRRARSRPKPSTARASSPRK